MGRSRVVHNPTAAEDDPTQRSKRRRVPTGGENLETLSTGQGTNDGKRALYHCNYCNKDISGKIRTKCVKCTDFDLCVECFSVGAEVTPHKSIHHYRVMDSLSFPLITPDWYADEEILLLEGIEMYGLGNWTEIAEHVGTKSKQQCIDHYNTAYMNSPCFPLPDMSHVVGKNRKELLAMAKVQGDKKEGSPYRVDCVFPPRDLYLHELGGALPSREVSDKGLLGAGEITPKEESPFSPSRVKVEEAPAGRSPSGLIADGDSGDSKINGVGGSNMNVASASAGKKASNMVQFKDGSDGIKVEGMLSAEDSQMDRSVGGKKPKYTGDKGPPMAELSGYNPKRQEFDPEYDNDAEQLLADMEFKDTDTEAERELKLRVLRIYSSRLDERKRRKDFVLERKLLYPNPIEKDLSSEEREIYNRYKVFMRYHSQEAHDSLVKTVIEEHRLKKKIQELQEARSAGCRTRSEADAYLAQKKKREAEASARKAKETSQLTGNGKVLQKANRPGKGESEGSPRSTIDNHKMKGSMGLESGGKDSSLTTTGTIIKSLEEWDIAGLPGTDLLSEAEQRLCCQKRLLPSHYLKILEVLTLETINGNIMKRSDAYRFFKVDPAKVDCVYNMAIKKGLVPRDEAPVV